MGTTKDDSVVLSIPLAGPPRVGVHPGWSICGVDAGNAPWARMLACQTRLFSTRAGYAHRHTHPTPAAYRSRRLYDAHGALAKHQGKTAEAPGEGLGALSGDPMGHLDHFTDAAAPQRCVHMTLQVAQARAAAPVVKDSPQMTSEGGRGR